MALPCTVDNCESCEQIENKFINIEKSVWRTVLEIYNVDWIEFQDDDPVIKIIKEYNKNKILLDWSEISNLDYSLKMYYLYWESLTLKYDVLY